MREILFRGKQKVDNLPYYHKGQWVYGDYVRMVDGKRNIPHIYGCGEIEPETVGQYTGLTDKNGKKIFEGDIVQAKRICNSDDWVGCVVFWNGCFAIQGLKDRNVPAIDLFNEYEVIGNIHDNPELLKGDKSDA